MPENKEPTFCPLEQNVYPCSLLFVHYTGLFNKQNWYYLMVYIHTSRIKIEKVFDITGG